MDGKTIGIILSFLSAITWGLAYTLDEKILDKTSPLALVFVNALINLVITFPILINQHQHLTSLTKSGAQNIALIIFSSILLTLGSLLILASIKATNASMASIIEISYPLFVVFFSIILLKYSPTPGLLIGGGLIITGSLIVAKFA